MSKPTKLLSLKFFQSHWLPDIQKVPKPKGDIQRPSFKDTILTNIIGVELDDLAKAEISNEGPKFHKKGESRAIPVPSPTHDPHNLVRIEVGMQNTQRLEIPGELRSRESLRSDHDNISQADRISRGIYE